MGFILSGQKTTSPEKKLPQGNSLDTAQTVSKKLSVAKEAVPDQVRPSAQQIKRKKVISTEDELANSASSATTDVVVTVDAPIPTFNANESYILAQNTEVLKADTASTSAPTSASTSAPVSGEPGFSSSGVQSVASPPVTPSVVNPVVEGVKSFSTAIDSALAGLSAPAQLAVLGGGVIASASVLGGGSGSGAATAAAGASVDTTPPTFQSLSLHSNGGGAGNATLVLTFNEAVDTANLPAVGTFAITINGVANVVTGVAASGSTITLSLTLAVAAGANVVTVVYTDPTAANDPNAAQDTSGNDVATFTITSGIVADGYIRGAQMYLDTPTGLQILTGVVTDSFGNFFIASDANPNNYALVAVGGVNIDTGLPNTMQIKAPAGSSSLNPITTIVTAVQQANGIVAMTAAEAAASSTASAASVVKSLGITFLGGATDLLSYNPIKAGDTSTQKVAAQIATVVALASSEASAGQVTTTSNAVFSNLATSIANATAANTTVSMTDASTISQALSNVTVSAAVQSAIADATTSISTAVDIAAISKTQSQFLDTIAPGAPTSITATATTNDTTPTVRVNLNVTTSDGKAAVAGDQVILLDGSSQAGTATLSSTDISNGYVDVTSTSTLLPGSHSFTAKLIDQSGNTGTVSSASAVTIDTNGPSVAIKSSAGNIATGAKVTLTIIFSEAVAGFTKDDITIPNGAVLGTLSAPTTLSDGSVKYTIDYTAPSTGGVGTLQIAANSYTDIATNNGAISNSLDLSVIAPPLVSIKSIGGADSKVSTQTGDKLIAGFGEAGLDVTITKTGGADLGTATADANGVWTYTLTDANITALGQGADSITASQTKTGVTGPSSAFIISVDTVAPTGLTITDVAGDNAIKASEKTAGVSVSGAAEANATVNLTVAGSTKVLTATAGTWTYTLTDADYKSIGTGTTLSAVAIDAAGNVGTAVTKAITVDTIAPILGQFKLAGTGTGVGLGMTNLATSSIVFSAETGATVKVYKGEVSVANLLGTATETGTTGSYSYTFGATVLSQNANTINIVAADLAGNTSTRTGTITLDSVVPTVVITDDETAVGNIAGGNILYTFTFSEGVTGFTADDITVANGTKAAGTFKMLKDSNGNSNKIYTIEVTPTAGFEGDVTVDVAAAAAIDKAGNNNTVATQSVQQVDTKAPTVVITNDEVSGTISNIAGGTILYTFTFSDAVTGFVKEDIVIGHGTAGAFAAVANSGGKAYTLVVTPEAGYEGNVTVDVPSVKPTAATTQAVDIALNPNVAATQNVQVIDTKAPTVVITDDESGVANIAGANVVYTFTFSEPVTGFEAADVTVTNGTKGTFTAVSSTVYTLAVTPTAGYEGDMTVNVASSAASDLNSNPSVAAAQSTQVVDTKAPTVVITDDENGVANIAGANVVYTFTFSEPVTGFDASDVTVTNGTKGTFITTSSTIYTLEVTPTAGLEGNITVDVAASKAIDANSNPNVAATQSVQVVDTKAPTVVITDDDSGVANIAGADVVYKFTFSEPVTGFAIGDITVANATGSAVPVKGTFTALSETEYTLAVTPTAGYEGSMTVNVASSAASDLISNPSVAATQSTQVVDTKAPTVVITDDESGVANIAGADIVYTFTFSEPVTGFDATDVTVANATGTAVPTKGTFTAVSSTVYTLAVTPTAGYEGNMTVDVAAVKAIDANSNPNLAATQSVQVVDTKVPDIVPFSPLDDGKTLGLVANLVLSANETVTKGSAGTVTLYKSSDNTIIETFDVASTQKITIAGTGSSTKISIDPTADLIKDQLYYVKASAGSFLDSAGNPWVGILNSTSWNFIGAGATVTIDNTALGGDDYVNAAEATAAATSGIIVSGTISGESPILDSYLLSDLAVTLGSTALTNLTFVHTTGSATGTWSAKIAPSFLTGTQDLTLLAQFTGTTGVANGVVSGATKVIHIDTAVPGQPTLADAAKNSAGYVNAAIQTVTGTAKAGSTVKIYDTNGTTVLGTGTANSSTGAYSITLSSMADGAHTLTAKATDAAGNTSVASSNFLVSVDTAAPSAPTIADSAINSSGYVNAAIQTVTGTAEASSTVTVYDTNGTTVLGTGTANSSTGLYSIALSSMTDATHTLTAKATDLAGNTSVASSNLVVKVDTAAPSQPTIADSAINAAGYVNAAVQTVTGTAEASSTVTVYDTDGTTVLGTGTANSSTGAYSIILSSMSNATHTLTAKATDAAGNTSASSSGLVVKVDTSPPNAPTIVNSAINVAGYVNAAIQTVTGVAEASSTVKVYDTNGTTLLGTGTANSSTGAYSIALSSLADGAHTLTAKAIDAAGNTSAASSNLTLSVDTVLPVISTAAVNAKQITLVYSENLDSGNLPAASAFAVTRAGNPGTVSAVSITDNTITLTLAESVQNGESVSLSYTNPSGSSTIHDLSGNNAVNLVSKSLTNSTAPPPVLAISNLNGVANFDVTSNIVLKYDSAVTAVANKYIHIINDANTTSANGFRGESTANTLDILVTNTSQVTFSSDLKTVILNPLLDLDLANNYHITIDDGAFAGASGVATAALSSATSLKFSTVTPGAVPSGTPATTSAAVASQAMDTSGNLIASKYWLDIENIGNSQSIAPDSKAPTVLDLLNKDYALVFKDYQDTASPLKANGSPRNDAIGAGNFWLAVNNFGVGDIVYIDNRGASNNLNLVGALNPGATDFNRFQFSPNPLITDNTAYGGYLDVTLASSATTPYFANVAELNASLGGQSSVITNTHAVI